MTLSTSNKWEAFEPRCDNPDLCPCSPSPCSENVVASATQISCGERFSNTDDFDLGHCDCKPANVEDDKSFQRCQ